MKFILLCILLFACSFSGNAIHFFNGTYEEALQLAKKEKKNLFISFTASWCGPCRMLSPVIEELAAEEPAIKFCKVNVDDEPGLAAQFGVSSIPTLIFSKNGALTGRTVGFRPKAELLELIDGIKD